MYIEGLDELDNKIIEVIKDQARLSYSEIGDRVGISRISVRKRMDALEKKGVIQGYKTVIDSARAAEGVRFIIDLETLPDCYEDMAAYLAGSPYVRRIYGMSGDCAIHAEGFASNSRNLQLFVNALYRQASKGIRRLNCKTVLTVLKDVDGGIGYERYQESEHMERDGEQQN